VRSLAAEISRQVFFGNVSVTISKKICNPTTPHKKMPLGVVTTFPTRWRHIYRFSGRSANRIDCVPHRAGDFGPSFGALFILCLSTQRVMIRIVLLPPHVGCVPNRESLSRSEHQDRDIDVPQPRIDHIFDEIASQF